ncbi:MAG TPA: lysophospholipid acyltransferase family protein [Candidatus Binatia bacterium]|nr:lysophospholipid acyltransferase family protein [Candidatus Binatia bacterium]
MSRKSKRPATKRFFLAVRYRAGELALRSLVGLLPLLPGWLVSFFTRLLARAAFFLLPAYRKRMEENVAASFGDAISLQEKSDLVWAAWLSFARGVLDTTQVMHYSRECILSTVALEGEEHVRCALEQGKGVLALSAHLGSFTMIGARLAAAGFPFSVVVKQPADERFARLIDAYRERIGIQTISAKPRREAVRAILKALRRNHIVLVIADEFKSGDVVVDFLGLKVPAPRGPATLALRTGAITLPMFVTRQPDDSLKLSVGPPITPVECPDLEQSVVATTALYTRHIEAAIRQTPGQWNWLGLPRRNGALSRAEIRRRRKALGISRRQRRLRARQLGSGTPS